jgi:hypothetical protein
MFVFKARLRLSAHSDFVVAVATIYWSAFAGLERYFGFPATLGAHRWEHLASEPVAVALISVALRLPCLAACRTALGLISIALRGEELLFLSTEYEGGATIGTLKGLVLEAHGMTSSLLNSWFESWSSST